MALRTRGWIGFVLLSSLLLPAAGCGDDDDGGDDVDSGRPDGGGQMDGGGSGGNGGSSGNGGSGGSAPVGDAMIPIGAECDPAIATSATCGGAMCPALTSPIAPAVCAVPCCLPSDECGTRRAYLDGPTECLPPAVPDTSCPDYQGGMGAMVDAGPDGGMMGMTFVGCCAPSGRCGVISTVDMSCITSSPLLSDLMPGDPCGDEVDAGGDADGG